MNERETPLKFHSLQIPRSPIACSPGRNLTGPFRIAKDITADLYNTIQRWNDLLIKGAEFVQIIAVEKSENPKKYSPLLEEQTNNLYAIVQDMKILEGRFRELSIKIKALDKIDGKAETKFLSLNIEGIVKLVETIVDAYLKEFKVKEEIVLENIAHARSKDEVMFFATCWTLQVHIRGINFKLETLLLETGHKKVN